MFQSLNWLDDEDVQFEKTCTKGLLTQEEIEKLRFDETLGDIDRALLIFSNGVDSQKISLIKQLPELLIKDPFTFVETILPKFVDTAGSATVELLNLCGQTVCVLIKTGLLTASSQVANFVPLMWLHIGAKDTAVHGAWLDALITFISFSTKEVLLQNDIIKLTLAKSNLSQKSSSRIASTKLITALCNKLDIEQIEGDVFPVIRMLCQDIDYDVRASMCLSLVDIARYIGETKTVKLLIPEIQELLQDEESHVRSSALQVLVDIVPLSSRETITQLLATAIWSTLDVIICEKPGMSQIAVSRLIGRLGFNLREMMDEGRKRWFVKYFMKLCDTEHTSNGTLENGTCTVSPAPADITLDCINVKDVDSTDSIAYLCAYNFPAVALCVGCEAVVDSGLLECYTKLSQHHHHSVRKVIAAGIHEVAKILESSSCEVLSVFKTLLCDPVVQVQVALVPHLNDTLLLFAYMGAVKVANPGIAPGLPELVEPLKTHERSISKTRNWRSYTSLIEAWSDFTNVLTPEQIYNDFALHLVKEISTNVVLPVKRATLRTLVKYMYCCKHIYHRNDLISQTVKCLARSKKFNQRLLFVEFCYLLLEKFSKKFFKEFCLTPALLLINDPIPTVRINSCTLLPHLKSQLKMPSDRPMLQQLEASSRRSLMSERDKEVLTHIQKAVIELDNRDVMLDSDPDLPDKKKEEEQNKYIVKEKKKPCSRGSRRYSLPNLKKPPSRECSAQSRECSARKEDRIAGRDLDVKSRNSLPDMNNLEINSKFNRRKTSSASLTEHDHSSASRRATRKMSQAAVAMQRRASHAHATTIPRRASMPTSSLVDVVNKSRTTSSVKLKSAGKKTS